MISPTFAQEPSFQIHSLWVKDFYKLKNFHIQFNSNISVLIGENGSGKSTVIECIADIFGHLYKYFVLGDLRENIRKQVELSGAFFFFKQWGTWGSDGVKRSKHANGKLLDGKVIQEMPEYTKMANCVNMSGVQLYSHSAIIDMLIKM